MWEAVARAVGDLDAVLGFEVRPFLFTGRPGALTLRAQMMNEPHRGYIDLPSLQGFDYNTDLHLGDVRAYTHYYTTPVNLGQNFNLGLWPQPRLSSLSFLARAIRRLLTAGRAHSRCPLDAPVDRCLTPKAAKPGATKDRRAVGTCGRCMVFGSGIVRRVPALCAPKNTS
jgi:hypothetical protein